MKTKFERAIDSARRGVVTPMTYDGKRRVDYFEFQLMEHKRILTLMAGGLFQRGVKFTDIRSYYGLKGRSAKDCLPQLEAIHKAYKARK